MMLALLLLSAATVSHPRGWADPREPFHVVGNVYSVGSAEVTSFLIATPKGHVLIDGGFAESAPQIARNIERNKPQAGVVMDEARVSTIFAIVAVIIFVIALGGTMWLLHR